jgi:hypothetical protein
MWGREKEEEGAGRLGKRPKRVWKMEIIFSYFLNLIQKSK